MPRSDYVRPAKSKSQGGNKIVIIAIVACVLVLSAAGLWLLKSNSPTPVVPPQNTASQPQSKSTLPSRPEEVYSYIRDLETREIRVDDSQQAQLNAEQLKKLEEQRAQEQRRLEEQRLAEQPNAPQMPQLEQPTRPIAQQPERNASQEEDAIAKKVREQEQKFAAEEKRKQQAEQQRKQEEAKKQAPSTQTQQTAKATDSTPKSSGKFGLQCGAFKNKAQAENMQARLAMAGYNARINSSADWNRVVVGPIGDRQAAVAAQSNAKSVADCVIVAM